MSESDGITRYTKLPRIAYMSMEIALNPEIPTYAGGLGVLAGDTVKTSADLNIPFVAVTLISRKGYLRQELSEKGSSMFHEEEWTPASYLKPLKTEVKLRIQRREVGVRAWLLEIVGSNGGTTPVLFLDTDLETNIEEDRRITDFLYGGDEIYRLKQEIVLGFGGIRLLRALGFKIRKFHLNESHSAFAALELLSEEKDIDSVRRSCVFTTHTPIDAGHDKFSYDVVTDVLGESYPEVNDFIQDHLLDMTRLSMSLSQFTNAVSKMHQKVSKSQYPGHTIHAITNGVHSLSWTSQPFKILYDKFIPGWRQKPDLLTQLDKIPNEEVQSVHEEAKRELVRYVKNVTDVDLDQSSFTIGFGRRITSYKRAPLIFSDTNWLRKIGKENRIQLIFGGRAHPKDEHGQKQIEEIFHQMDNLSDEIPIVYLENYDYRMASKFTSGVDLWLNTPQPPMEASGTSGMKAAHNGIPNFSILDGWWVEGWIEGVTGWSIGPEPKLEDDQRGDQEIRDIYEKLEKTILPIFYDDKKSWVNLMKNSIRMIATQFNTHRMLREYNDLAYN